MMRMRRTVAVSLAILLIFGLTGCFTRGPRPEAVEPSSAASSEPAEAVRTEVPWSDYHESVKTRIDEAEAVSDCEALQGEFDTADANNDQTMARTGHNNADLMRYINEAMQLAGC